MWYLNHNTNAMTDTLLYIAIALWVLSLIPNYFLSKKRKKLEAERDRLQKELDEMNKDKK